MWAFFRSNSGSHLRRGGALTVWLTLILSVLADRRSIGAVLYAFSVALAIATLLEVGQLWGMTRAVRWPLVEALDGVATERLLLRRPTRRDAAAFVAINDEVAREANGLTDAVVRAISKTIRADITYPHYVFFLITEKLTGAVLGDVSVLRSSDDSESCEVGWTMGPGHRGKGYGTEAMGAVFEALHAAGFRRIVVGTSPENVAVHRVMSRLGAHLTATRPHKLPTGTTIESNWFVHEQ